MGGEAEGASRERLKEGKEAEAARRVVKLYGLREK